MITLKAASPASGRVNKAKGIITGVSVITEGPAIGHGIEIDGTTLKQVAACGAAFTDGVKVKINHGTGFDNIVGVLRIFAVKGNKTTADLHLLKSHADYSRILEMAETMPGAFGLSIAFSGELETIGAKKYARCLELYSVDLVDFPAANPSGLFSALPWSSAAYLASLAPKQITRADFDKLTESDKMKFCTGHGKIVEKVEFGRAFAPTVRPTLTRAQFSKLSPAAQSAFFLKDGGKLTE